ncbi:unnamed protein product [Linum tenue]|uniref:Uncharacterized protein n=1 Tax=Linum tenue TaxID=586396 RepID=A0AAV0HUP0_9ROSI|nr:unnamed protein product [Linum tenue]
MGDEPCSSETSPNPALHLPNDFRRNIHPHNHPIQRPYHNQEEEGLGPLPASPAQEALQSVSALQFK